MNQAVDVTQNTLSDQTTLATYSHAQVEQMFQDLHQAYQNAETWAKRVENIIDDVPIAAINQMRYAGYHISKVLSKSKFFCGNLRDECLINIDDLRSAYKHLLRAYFDSLDQLTQQLSAVLENYEMQFSDLGIVVTDHFPDFFKWIDDIKEIGQFDISQNTDSVNQFAISPNDRLAHYQKIVDKISNLENIKQNFRAIANCLVVQGNRITNEIIALEKAETDAKEARIRELEALETAKNSARWSKGSVIVAILAILVAIVIAIFQ